MAWTLVAGGSGAGGGASVATVTLNSVTADVIGFIVTLYNRTHTATEITETGASPNTWALSSIQAAAGDANVKLGIFWTLSPNTHATHAITYTNGSGFPGAVGFALTQGAAATFIAEVQNGTGTSGNTRIKAGSIGSAGELVIEGIGFYTNNTMAIDSSFSTVVEQGYVGGGALGTAGSWKEAGGAVDPEWSWTGGNVVASKAVSFTGSGGGGGGGVTYPQLERGVRGLARGVAGGIARTFERRDRIFVPAYAVVGALKAAA